MTVRPSPTTAAQEELYGQLGAWSITDTARGKASLPGGWDLLNYVGAFTSMYDNIEVYARDTNGEPGWAIMMDPAIAPPEALGWLGQFVGVTLDQGATDAASRLKVKGESGFQRGTIAAMVAAAKKTLTGTQTVLYRERDPAVPCIYYGPNLVETSAGVLDFNTHPGVNAPTSVNLVADTTAKNGHAIEVVDPAVALSGTVYRNGTILLNLVAGNTYVVNVPIRIMSGTSDVRMDVTHISSGVTDVLTTVLNASVGYTVATVTFVASHTGEYDVRFYNTTANAVTFRISHDDLHAILRITDASGAYGLTILTMTAETPDAAATLRAIVAQKPAGIILQYATVAGATYLLDRTTYATYTALRAAFATYNGVRNNVPGT